MDQVQRIALLMGQDLGYCRGVLRGIHAYATYKRRWVFHDGPPDVRLLPSVREWRPHGIIAHVFDAEFARRVMALGAPLVNTTCTLPRFSAPLVDVDHLHAGCLAAEHFLERGYKSFGYFGSRWTDFSRQREEGFRTALAKAGFTVSSYYAEYLPRPPLDSSWKNVDRLVREWLLALAKPAAILASNDVPARHLAEICRVLQVRVPEHVALLGIDNDELECLLCHPPLSSVVNPAEQIGYEAARLLNRLMAGRQPPQRAIYIRPTRVVARQSTDIIAVADPDVSAATAFIRDHAAENISVANVVYALSLARRRLERRFQELLGRTVLQEIQRVRIERVKHLLAETDLPMSEIARRSGFSTPQRLAVVFRQTTAESPTAYRRRTQLRA
jgi:LacI family transcriptional regulator